jgi:uncharacterized protein
MNIKPLTFLLALTFLFLFSGSVYGGDWKDGLDAFDRKDYKAAHKLLLSAVKQNENSCCKGQILLGLMYETGEGTSQNSKEAVKWYRLAAKKHDPVAQFKLGEMYHKGKGVPQNYKLAVKWYLLSAKMGNKHAKLNLRQLAKKSPDALELLITSAEDGDSKSQYHLGLIYLEVSGLQDYVLAHKWFNLAGSQGNQYGEENRILVEDKMTPSQIEKAQELAKKWTPPSKLKIFLRLWWEEMKKIYGYDYWNTKFFSD